MSTRTFFCPDCEGEGGFTVNNSIGAYGPDPQCDEHRDCGRCEGSGRLQLDPERDDTDGLTPFTPSRRRWINHWPTADKRDPLVAMAQYRHDAAHKGRCAYLYAIKRKAAMKLADLPQDDECGLVSPETAAYFNELARNAA
jgi:hypothetical protein